MSLVPDFVVTTVYFAVTLVVAEVFRRSCRVLANLHPLVESAAQEFIASFELCAVCYEISIWLEYDYGVVMYAFYLFLASAWWTSVWEEATAAPYSQVVSYLYEGRSLTSATVLILCQLIGGLMFFQFYIKPLWFLGFGDIHFQKISGDSYCTSDIQVGVLVAALVEGAGVFCCLITGKILTARLGMTKLSIGGGAFVCTALVIAAMSITGGYFNPVLATALQFGCFGSTPTEHFFVYWVAETVGAILAHHFWEGGLRGIVEPRSKTD